VKTIEALKRLKEIPKKIEDLTKQVTKYCAFMSFETPTYTDKAEQTKTVSGWLQAIHDLTMEYESLSARVAYTNLLTMVTIEIGARSITKSVHAWVQRRGTIHGIGRATKRNGLASLEETAWRGLNDGTRQEGVQKISGVETKVIIERCYDPKVRDNNIDMYSSEAHIIDGKLEITNAVTDLLDLPKAS